MNRDGIDVLGLFQLSLLLSVQWIGSLSHYWHVHTCYLAASQSPDFCEGTDKQEVGLRSVCAVPAICFALMSWV